MCPVGDSSRQLDLERAVDIGVTARFNRLLATLPESDLANLAPFMKEIPLQRGALLHHSGEAVKNVYFPHTGMISIVTVMRGGEQVETATVGCDGALGTEVALGSKRASGMAVVQLAGTAMRIAASHFIEAASGSIFIRHMAARYNTLMIAQIQQSVACNALHDAEARVCRWLLTCADSAGSNTIPLTQDSLGRMLGVRRTTVTLIARMLKVSGVIRYRRGLIEIVDRAALERSACECYATLRQEHRRLYPSPETGWSATANPV